METASHPDQPLNQYLRWHAQLRFIDALPATSAGKVLRRLLKDA
jgi:acyl-coenzyme A synthetase/AMP-(fatty) acid ligase